MLSMSSGLLGDSLAAVSTVLRFLRAFTPGADRRWREGAQFDD